MSVNKTKAFRSSESGNGLAAIQDLEAGEVIIGIDNPLLVVVEKAALERCKVVRYCSVACQSSAWKSIHKKECQIFKRLPRAPPTAVRGVMQLLLRKAIEGTSDSRWMRLESHMAELQSHNRWGEIVFQAKAAVEWTSSPPEYMESVLNVLCRMATNAFRVTMADSTPIGLCFEPDVSLANHSCTPNAAIMFDGRRIALRAVDPIKMGEQIFISYIDITQTRDERRQELKDRYFFTCRCEKCEQGDGPYQTLLKSQPILDPRLDLLLGQKEIREIAQARSLEVPLIDTQNPVLGVNGILSRSRDTSITQTKQLSLLKDALAISKPLRRRKLFAQSPYPLILQELYLHYLANASTYTRALSLLLFIYLNCDVYHYPQPHHPFRVTRLYSIAKLLKNIEGLQHIDVVSANQTLLLCVRRLGAKSHGAESRFMKEVEEEIEDVQAVQKTRGDVGKRLEEWSMRDDAGEAGAGAEYVKTIFQGLRNLSTEALDG